MGNIFGSLIAHATLFALLVIVTRDLTETKSPPPARDVEVSVTLRDSQIQDADKLEAAGKKSQRAKVGLPSLASLAPGSLKGGLKRLGRDAKGGTRGHAERNSGAALTFDSVAAGEAMATTGGGAYPYLKYMRERLANAILYPEKLLDERRDGIIAFDITVDSKGRLISEPRVALSGDPHLMSFTRKEVVRVMKLPLNKNVHLPGKTMSFTAQFDFRSVTRPDLKSPNIPLIVKNTLYIYPQAVRDPTFLYGGGTQGYDMSVSIDPIKASKTLKRTL